MTCPRLRIRIKSAPHRGSAFTLLEVVVSVALFAAAAIALSGAFVNALLLREHGQSQQNFQSDLHMVRLQLLLEPDLEQAEDGGSYQTIEMGLADWNALIEPTNVVDLFKVAFTVEFPEAPEGQPSNHSETLYLLRPSWSESDERSALLEEKAENLRDRRDF